MGAASSLLDSTRVCDQSAGWRAGSRLAEVMCASTCALEVRMVNQWVAGDGRAGPDLVLCTAVVTPMASGSWATAQIVRLSRECIGKAKIPDVTSCRRWDGALWPRTSLVHGLSPARNQGPAGRLWERLGVSASDEGSRRQASEVDSSCHGEGTYRGLQEGFGRYVPTWWET